MSHIHSRQTLVGAHVARVLLAATVFSSSAMGQAPCEPRHPARPSAKRAVPAAAPSVDWTTMPSTYTHDPNGQRVDQYAKGVEPETYGQADFVRSGYTHTRSSLQVGFNADHYHVTEQWGPQVRPYGEWRFPYRPFSTPYGAWGPQLPQVSVQGVGVYPWATPGPWQGGPWQGGPWQGGPWQGGPWQGGPWQPGPGGSGPMGAAGMGAAGMGAMGPVGAMGGMGPSVPGPSVPGPSVPGPSVPGPGVPGPGVPPGHPGMHPWGGYPQGVPWWGYPGVSPYAPYGGVGPYGVGPANGLSPIQEDYYPQAPIYQQPSDGYFHSPYRNVP